LQNKLVFFSAWIKTTKLASTIMSAMNSTVLACNYARSGCSDLNAKLTSMPSVASPQLSALKLPLIKAHQAKVTESKSDQGRRSALVYLAATLFTAAAAASNSSANAGVIEEYLEKSKTNKVSSNPSLFTLQSRLPLILVSISLFHAIVI